MTREEAKSELMQIYMSLSEKKKQALDVLMAIPSVDMFSDLKAEISMYENSEQSIDEMIQGIKSIISIYEPQEISDRNLKMWHDIYEEEKRRSDKE